MGNKFSDVVLKDDKVLKAVCGQFEVSATSRMTGSPSGAGSY